MFPKKAEKGVCWGSLGKPPSEGGSLQDLADVIQKQGIVSRKPDA